MIGKSNQMLLVSEADLRQIIKEECGSALSTAVSDVRASILGTYTFDEVCEKLHVSRPTLYVYISQGKLSPKKVGRKNLFSAQAVDDLVLSLNR